MADISKCEGEDCRLRDTCYRFLVKANPHRQSYIKPDPENCKYYWLTCECSSDQFRQKLDGLVCNNCDRFYDRCVYKVNKTANEN